MQIDDFCQYLHSQDRAETTVTGYARDLNKFSAWFEQTTGHAPTPVTVTPLDIRAYRQYLQTVKRYKPASINRRLAALRVYFRWVCEIGLVAGNPATNIKMIEHNGQAEARWLDREETYALLRAAREAIQLAEAKGLKPSADLGKRNAAILSLLLHGLRVSELCALHLKDVTLNDRSGQVVVYGKGRKYREVPLNLDARKAIKQWLEVRPVDDGPYLFTGRREAQLKPRAVQRVLDRLAQAANLDPARVTPHACRHTFGKNLVDAGTSLDRVAILLGHSDLSTTAVYTTPSRDDLAAAVDKIAWED